MKIDSSVTAISGVGKAVQTKLRRLGIETVEQLLWHLPFRYDDYSKLLAVADIEEGTEGTIQGVIEAIVTRRSKRKRMLLTEAVLRDDAGGQLRIVWFNQPYISNTLRVGNRINVSGKVGRDMLGPQMVSPAFEKITKEEDGTTVHTAKIVPIYPLTTGLTQKALRGYIHKVLPLIDDLEDWVPKEIVQKGKFLSIQDALQQVHDPASQEQLDAGLRRLKFDELFVLQLRGALTRQTLDAMAAPAMSFYEKEMKAFADALPFTLTNDQKKAVWSILKDMEHTTPMNRLLEGDVGAGKTVVAAMVSYHAVLNTYQVALMAPTDILASQHFSSLQKSLPKEINIGLFTRTKRVVIDEQGEEQKLSKKKMIEALANGEVDIVIGTHALVADGVTFKDLGLTIVDEQHRFGVAQRKKLKAQSGNTNTMPHFLSMTATPIPRSFALALYGDLDISIIKEKPAGRKPIKTRLVSPQHRIKAYEFIRGQVKQGRQVFVVCPLIEEKETDIVASKTALSNAEKKTVMSEYKKLSEEVFPALRVDFLHGKRKAEEKAATMNEFAKGNIDILVSTSVVEVGVDVPNATVMMIEGAERFGLAQLHQFRGRVGRSDHQSYCFLFTDNTGSSVTERLSFFESHNDGFALAEYDLKQRGPGEVYGKQQSGLQQFVLASLQDTDLIAFARDAARDIDDIDDFLALLSRLEQWERDVHLE